MCKLCRFAILIVMSAAASGCIRTGNLGRPIGERYKSELDRLVIGETTPSQLQKVFGRGFVKKIEPMGFDEETWRLKHSGNTNPALFLATGVSARDKDQALLFHFNSGVLSGYESEVLPDYEEKKVAKGKTYGDAMKP